jgi:hypothetical protein
MKKRARDKPETGRLVWNHSTHIDGLIPVLTKLLEQADIATITPGVLSRGKAHAPRLALKVSVPILGGYKLIARQGKSIQEVFAVTAISQPELEQAIAKILN